MGLRHPLSNLFPTCAREDETRNARRNANQNPEWWGDFSQPHIQIQPKSGFEIVPRDTEKFKFDQILISNLYREIPEKFEFLDFDQLTSIPPPFRIPICIPTSISSLIFSGLGFSLMKPKP